LAAALKGLTKGLDYAPDLFFILSDESFGGQAPSEAEQQRLLEAVQKANKRGCKINTIQFAHPGKPAPAGKESVLELISSQSGGVYKLLDAKEVGIR
jgi:hypothetical protein